jgi:hypothetical protein
VEELIPKGGAKLNANLLEGFYNGGVALAGVRLYIAVPVDGCDSQSFRQSWNSLTRLALKNQQLSTGFSVPILQHFQAAHHVGDSGWGNIIALEDARVEAEDTDDVGAAIAGRHQPYIIGQSQVAPVPKED